MSNETNDEHKSQYAKDVFPVPGMPASSVIDFGGIPWWSGKKERSTPGHPEDIGSAKSDILDHSSMEFHIKWNIFGCQGNVKYFEGHEPGTIPSYQNNAKMAGKFRPMHAF